MKKKIIIAVVVAAYVALGWICFGRGGHAIVGGYSADYARGVNDALDSCSVVIRDRRDHHQRMPNYQELGREVCSRLKVKRDEWFYGIASK